MLPRRTENTCLAQPPDFEADQLCTVYATAATDDRLFIAELKDTWAQNDNTQEAAYKMPKLTRFEEQGFEKSSAD